VADDDIVDITRGYAKQITEGIYHDRARIAREHPTGTPSRMHRESRQLGILNSALAAATDSTLAWSSQPSATVNLYASDGDGVLTATGETLTAYNRSETAFASGDFVELLFRWGKWQPMPTGGGSGSGSDCACCVCVSNPDLEHPDLAAGFDQTVQQWGLQSTCGDDLDAITTDTADGLGTVTWLGGKPLLLWHSGNGVWELDDSGNCTVANNAGTDKTGTSTITADWTRDFVASEEVVTLELDAVVA